MCVHTYTYGYGVYTSVNANKLAKYKNTIQTNKNDSARTHNFPNMTWHSALCYTSMAWLTWHALKIIAERLTLINLRILHFFAICRYWRELFAKQNEGPSRVYWVTLGPSARHTSACVWSGSGWLRAISYLPYILYFQVLGQDVM